MMGKNEKHGSIHSGIPTPEIKQAPVIPFVNEQQYRKNTISSSVSYFKTETSKTNQLKSQTNLPLEDKESTFLSQDIAYIWVSTEVYYNKLIYNKKICPRPVW